MRRQTRVSGLRIAALFLVAVLALTFRMLWNLDALSLESGDPTPEEPSGGKENES